MDGSTGLAAIDVAIILVYMLGVLVLGAFFGRYVKDGGDFFVGGKALPFWAIGMSIVVSDIGAMDFIGVAGETYNSGIAVANFDWLGSMPAMVLAAFIFVPYYWRSGVYTIPEFLGQRYNHAVQTIHAAIWGVFLFVTTSLGLWVTAEHFLNQVLGWNVYFSVWLMVGIVGIYTFSGGLTAVVMTDVVQMVIMFVGGAALVLLSLYRVGGDVAGKVTGMPPKAVVTINVAEPVSEADVQRYLEDAGFTILSVTLPADVPEGAAVSTDEPRQFIVRFSEFFTQKSEKLAAREQAWKEAETRVTDVLTEHLSSAPLLPGALAPVDVRLRGYRNHLNILLPNTTTTAFPWTGIVFGLGIVMATAYMSGNQAIVQRTLGARSEWDAKGGMLFAGFLKSFIPLLVAIPGLCAVVLLPDLEKGDDAVPYLMRALLPPGLRGLMFSAMFAGLMSSMDSALNSASTIWTTDLYGQLARLVRGENISERHALFAGRTFTFIFVLLAGALAEWIGDNEGLYNFLQTALSMFQGPVFAILLLGIMWKRATRWGGLAGLLLGVAFTTVLNNVEGLFPSDDPFLFVSWWSFVFSLIVTVIVSLATPPEPDEKIRGLVFGQVLKDGEIQRILRIRSEK